MQMPWWCPTLTPSAAARKKGWTCEDFAKDESEKCNTGKEKQFKSISYQPKGAKTVVKGRKRSTETKRIRRYPHEVKDTLEQLKKEGAREIGEPQNASKANCSDECKEAQACVLTKSKELQNVLLFPK